MRSAGSCHYGGASGLAVGAGRLLVGVSILDRDSGEHESGYVALDPATGEVLWTARASSEGNTAMSGAPRFAEDGFGYGSRTVDYLRDELLVFSGGAPPRCSLTPRDPWHGSVLAAYGPLLVSSATGGASWAGPPSGLEIRCRADGSVRAPAGSVTGQPLLAGGALWFFGDHLARYDAATGTLRWQVALGTPPSPPAGGPFPRPVLFRSPPVVTAGGTIVFTEQPGVAGAISSQQDLGTPVLREIDGDGREVLRRELPLETEAYDGRLALHRGPVPRWSGAALGRGDGGRCGRSTCLSTTCADPLDRPEGSRRRVIDGRAEPDAPDPDYRSDSLAAWSAALVSVRRFDISRYHGEHRCTARR